MPRHTAVSESLAGRPLVEAASSVHMSACLCGALQLLALTLTQMVSHPQHTLTLSLSVTQTLTHLSLEHEKSQQSPTDAESCWPALPPTHRQPVTSTALQNPTHTELHSRHMQNLTL
jgi:hypothetical protein